MENYQFTQFIKYSRTKGEVIIVDKTIRYSRRLEGGKQGRGDAAMKTGQASPAKPALQDTGYPGALRPPKTPGAERRMIDATRSRRLKDRVAGGVAC